MIKDKKKSNRLPVRVAFSWSRNFHGVDQEMTGSGSHVLTNSRLAPIKFLISFIFVDVGACLYEFVDV